MKTYFKKLAVYLLLLIVVSIGISWFCNAVVMRRSIVLRKDAQYSAACQDIEYLFFGDSHALMGVNPDYIPHSFNFGMAAENIVQTYYKLSYFLEHPRCETKPRCVILPFDQHSFSSQRLTEWAYDFYYFRFMSPVEAGLATDDLPEYLLRYTKSKVWSYQDQGGAMIDWAAAGLFGARDERPMIRGYTANTLNFSTYSDSARASVGCRRAAFFFDSKEFELFSPVTIDFYRRTLDLCEQHGIPVVLVSYPVSKEFGSCAEEKYGANPALEAVAGLLDGRRGVYRFDLHDLYWEHTEFFGDADHLNVEGAKRFSTYLSGLLANLKL